MRLGRRGCFRRICGSFSRSLARWFARAWVGEARAGGGFADVARHADGARKGDLSTRVRRASRQWGSCVAHGVRAFARAGERGGYAAGARAVALGLRWDRRGVSDAGDVAWWVALHERCLLYTSDAADERSS